MMTEAFAVTEQDVAELYDIYLHLLDSNNDTRRQAEESVEAILLGEVVKLVLASASIVRMEDAHRNSIFQALVQIRRAFSPTPQIPRDFIAKNWLEVPPERRTIVHEAIIRALRYPDLHVIGIASRDFALVLACEGSGMLALISEIFALVMDETASSESRLGALKTLEEVTSPDILGSRLDDANVVDALHQIYAQLMAWLLDASDMPDSFLCVLLAALTSVTLVTPPAIAYRIPNHRPYPPPYPVAAGRGRMPDCTL
jgi:hypothetical protein